jgi:hypothetical protein
MTDIEWAEYCAGVDLTNQEGARLREEIAVARIVLAQVVADLMAGTTPHSARKLGRQTVRDALTGQVEKLGRDHEAEKLARKGFLTFPPLGEGETPFVPPQADLVPQTQDYEGP